MSVVSPTSYHTFFHKVLIKRLKYVNNINILLAIAISIALRVPYGSFWWNLLLTVFRAPVLYAGLLVVKQSRVRLSTVDIAPYKSLASQVYHSVCSGVYLQYASFYVVSVAFFTGVFVSQLPHKLEYYLHSKEYRQSPLVNDKWVYTLFFHPAYLAAFYLAHHLVFQRNRLVFKYGSQKLSPDDTLLAKVPLLLLNALVLTVFVAGSSPLLWLVVRSLCYKANYLTLLVAGLDTQVPGYGVTVSTVLSLAFFSYQVLLAWELVNHAFNVYSTIGCLDGKKPISTYSADPLNTLLNGLRNVNEPLSRLSAFQELAYVATSNDPEAVKLRAAIYSARSKKGYILTSILEECSLVIRETTLRVSYRSSSDIKALKSEVPKDDARDDSDIFGNSFVSAAGTPQKSNSIKKYPQTHKQSSYKQARWYVILENQVLVPTTPKSTFVAKVYQAYRSIDQIYNVYNGKFLATNLGVLFRTTLKRDTGSRIGNPVNFGNAIISVSNLLIHSIEEDKIGCVTNTHIRDVMELLEKPIRATGDYTDTVPASVFLTEVQKTNKKILNNHLIAVLHDLAMHEFFQLCVKFNYKLNDMVLNPKTYKLAKWVIDVAIAQQQQNQQQTQKTAIR
ncbi:nuclear envelope protein [Suhomyces tanzawaensis NRRL Y-17324]|uniref:Nuclear envelope protein n=1 Tax=Suhomyces tanzawaensis NRRL Y-17324 TaxID=984487 RepID=A0A1E4SHG4_9ASCO|nr:nuclear envelope protein [Suhomyces tanzawaensis NRRL Y-17324]ODV78910.1 nuclear envelope protein [Suhomyces tanzawaensis NRRL Y-17324]